MKKATLFILSFLSLNTLLFGAETAANLKAAIVDMQTKGANYLLQQQEKNGAWFSQSGMPAFTALAILGIHDSPLYLQKEVQQKMEKALDFIAKSARPDGSIAMSRPSRGKRGNAPSKHDSSKPKKATQRQSMGNYTAYNTSICLLALAKYNRPQDLKVIQNARNYLMGPDASPDNTPLAQSKGAAGIGYGGHKRSDLSNTAWALEALHATNYLDKEPYNKDAAVAQQSDLAWENAIAFLSTCQNLEQTNKSAWIHSAPKEDKGGFIYCPSEALKSDASPQALRSYGSMTYAAVKSMIYAKIPKDDIRMQSAFVWIKKYYTLNQNPGIGDSGFYFYLQTFSKTLALYKEPIITDSRDVKHDWKAELVEKLQETQQKDGSWSNQKNGRWMESMPILSTSYCLLTLANIK